VNQYYLVNDVIAPVGVERVEFAGKVVVLAEQQGLEGGEQGALTGPRIRGQEAEGAFGARVQARLLVEDRQRVLFGAGYLQRAEKKRSREKKGEQMAKSFCS